MRERETFGTRLGFILVSVGCAVGLGNVWKFPYICGRNGGAFFILIYLIFLGILGFPIMVCEFSVGRGSRKSCATSFGKLQPEGRKWHRFGYFGMVGNYLLMMFYTVVAGWMLSYCFRCLAGEFTGQALSVEQVAEKFDMLKNSTGTLIFWTVVVVFLSFGICSLGVRNGVEKITKVMMICLLGLIFIDAMSQAFFTLSVGIGSMAIFGSYMDKGRSLTGESITITLLDTFVALMAGLIIIPACFSFGIEPGAGPSLIFITLPNIFNQMAGGRVWGTLFFLFMSFAALSTVTAVYENIISFAIDLWNWERKKAVVINIIAMVILSMPCVLGFHLLSGIRPLGEGTNIMDMEDFLVSSNFLPLGALVYLLLCTTKGGWGWDNFIREANTGEGMKFPEKMRGYMTYVLPAIVVVIYVKGYWDMFSHKGWKYFLAWMAVAAIFLFVVGWFVFGGRKKSGKE